MKQQNSQTTQSAQPPTISERLLKVKSIIGTSRCACLHLSNESESEFFDISETLLLVEEMIGECAEELNEKGGRG